MSDSYEVSKPPSGFPIPFPTTINTQSGPTLTPGDGDLDVEMPLLVSPGSFNAFDGIWMEELEQETTTAILHQAIATTDSNGVLAPFTPPPDTRNECLNKLGYLQKKVLTNLDVVKACDTADNCKAAMLSDSSHSPNFLIGQMFDHSTALIEILDCFQPVSTSPNATLTDQPPSVVENRPEAFRCDVPTMFSLLSCYVCLTRIYRTILSSIHDSMPFLSGLIQPVPQLFPGMNLGGFKLEARLDLQVQILVQVSEDMLGKIEARFGISSDVAEATQRAIFEPEWTAKMLQMMLGEEANEQPPLNRRRGHCEPLRDILASLKRILREKSLNSNG